MTDHEKKFWANYKRLSSNENRKTVLDAFTPYRRQGCAAFTRVNRKQFLPDWKAGKFPFLNTRYNYGFLGVNFIDPSLETVTEIMLDQLVPYVTGSREGAAYCAAILSD